VGLAQLTDTEAADKCDYKPCSEKLRTEHFRTLREKGVVVIDDALSAEELEAVRHDLKAMESELSCEASTIQSPSTPPDVGYILGAVSLGPARL
jgi:hypothetical protein